MTGAGEQSVVRRRRQVVPLLAAPGFTGAVAVLALNDHVLKRRWPGSVTGKVSDVAGLVIVAVLVCCVVRVGVVAVAITASGFIVLKTSGSAAVLAAPVLGGVTAQDSTDLLAMAVLVPVWVWLRRRDQRTALRVAPISLLQLPALVVAVAVTTATSCDEPARVDRLVTAGTAVWAGIAGTGYDDDGQAFEEVRWARSDDGGRHWIASNRPPEAGTRATSEACVQQRCWRTIAGQRVEIDDGNGWDPAFAFSSEQWRQQELATSACDFPREHTFGAVAVVDGVPGQPILVTMGTQGVLRYDGGTWERVAVLGRTPAPMPGPSWMFTIPFWTVVGLGAGAVVLVVCGSFRQLWGRPNRRWRTAATVAGLAAGGLSVAAGGLIYLASRFYPIWSALAIGLAVGVFTVSVVIIARPPKPLPAPIPLSPPTRERVG